MTYAIEHITRYDFSSAVFLEPHTVRLNPRQDGTTVVLEHTQAVVPAPFARSRALDHHGNVTDRLWFSGTTERLSIRQSLRITNLRDNPFDYIPDPASERLPQLYQGAAATALAPYLATDSVDGLRAFLIPLVGSAVYNDIQTARTTGTIADHGLSCSEFVMLLTQTLSERYEAIVREDGEAWPAERTLRERAASCRDLTVLFCAACRDLGIASRFVSGYQAGDPDQDQDTRDLHAWAEVYTTDGGWRGFDPTLGLAVADEHIALAAAADPVDAAPVTGSFRGTGARSHLHHEIHLTTNLSS